MILLIIIVCGVGGYYRYYSAISDKSVISRTLYSTIRLFGASFDIDYGKAAALEDSVAVIAALEIAKWLAIFITGHVIFKLLRPYLSRFFVAFGLFAWGHKKRQVLIIGNNSNNLNIYRTVKKPYSPLLLADSLEDCEALSEQGIRAATVANRKKGGASSDYRGTGKWLRKVLERAVSRGERCTVIINTGNDEDNLNISKTAVEWLSGYLSEYRSRINDPDIPDPDKAGDRRYIVSVFEKIRIYVFGDRAHQAVYGEFQKNSAGVLNYINKYRLVAFDFVENNPLTEYIGKETFSKFFSNAAVSRDFDFNVIMLGFGEINREILSVSVANNQFSEQNPGGIPALKKVNYHIFDRDKTVIDRNLSNTLLRYEKEFLYDIGSGLLDKNDYSDLPDTPANIYQEYLDVNDTEFNKRLKYICTANPNSENHVIVAIGGDLENMDVAQRLSEKKKEWGIDNVRIFARVSGGSMFKTDYYTFGNEEKLVYDYNMICRNKFEELAIRRNLMYDYENNRINKKPASYEELETLAKSNWYVTMDSNKRLSNFYSILSLRMKLQLLGLDCREGDKPENAGEAVTSNEEYFDIYAGSYRPTVAMARSGENGKDIYSYDELPQKSEFEKGGVRSSLTVQEHYRWNAFMVSCGFIPQSIGKTLEKGSKSYEEKTHANLSSFEGLFQYRKAMAEHLDCEQSDTDVIKYDCQLMDDAWWFLDSKGYKVFRRW